MTAPVRPGEEIDLAALSRFLEASAEVEQFPDGHSNLVYLVRTPGREYILRRPPLGPVAPKAHDMAREFRVLSAIHAHFPEAPRPVALCEDDSVLGSAFFLMERRHGIVLRDGATGIPNPRVASEAFVDTLARLHAVDVSLPDIAALGKPEGFLERQVRGWSDRWERAKTEGSPRMEGISRWLRENMPPSAAASIVHNDYKLDNVMLSPAMDRVTAVLDWEMTTLGDPLADLGLSLCYWESAPQGFYTRDEFAGRYAEATGRDTGNLDWYEVLGIFKLAVILQQIYFRYRRGQTRDGRFSTLDTRVHDLIARAEKKLERG